MATPPTPKHKPEGHFKLDRMQSPSGPLPPWPRPGTRRRDHVGGADTWETVAKDNGIDDVWDLISWNFGTGATPEPSPREVNWFMHRYLGCWRATADGKNFRFLDADPGWVNIPPIGWKRGMAGLPLHTTVSLALSKLVSNFPHLNFAPYTVKPIDLHHVRAALNDGRLGARVVSGLKNLAEYDIDKDEFLLKSPATSSFNARITIVHEATHAMVDRKYAGLDMRRWENEVIAYTAEALWAWNTDSTRAEAMLDDGSVANSSKAAVRLAHYLHMAPGTTKKIKDFDKTVPNFRDPSVSFNPLRNLKIALWEELRANGDDPMDVMLMNGWKRPAL